MLISVRGAIRSGGGWYVDARMQSTRRLTPTEQVIGSLVCEGLSNVAIAKRISITEKAVENTIFRLARSFEIKTDGETNCRVLLALAFRAQFGDGALDKLGVPCSHQAVGPDSTFICVRDFSESIEEIEITLNHQRSD